MQVYITNLYCITVTESNADGHSLCDIRFNGAFPSFSIIDVVGQGAASQISKANLWKMLSIDK